MPPTSMGMLPRSGDGKCRTRSGMENGRIMFTRMKIVILAVAVIPVVLGTTPTRVGAKEKTGQLTVSASVAHVCDVLTLSRAHDFETFEERLRYWRISIMCAVGLNFQSSFQNLDLSAPLGEDGEIVSTDLSLTSRGSGTGQWEPLIDFETLLDASGENSENIQLTLTY